jgi:zinc and cadmium transporter
MKIIVLSYLHLLPNILLFLLTFVAGIIAFRLKIIEDENMNLLLAFSGSFLLSITFLHLLPETFEELGHKAGVYILLGFFLQLLIQRLTHGVEHGHAHIHSGHGHGIPLLSILAGLGVHSFMEGLPLGFNYRLPNTDTALYLAVAAHKLPEAMLVATIIRSAKGRSIKAIGMLFIFSLFTPAASIMASFLGTRYHTISEVVGILIPIVAGAFIHIATTIFFESGTKQHALTWQKTIAILAGVALGAATLLAH